MTSQIIPLPFVRLYLERAERKDLSRTKRAFSMK